jgi:hypothetical protein
MVVEKGWSVQRGRDFDVVLLEEQQMRISEIGQVRADDEIDEFAD